MIRLIKTFGARKVVENGLYKAVKDLSTKKTKN